MASHRETMVRLLGRQDVQGLRGVLATFASAFDDPVVHCPGSGREIRRIGVITGGGQNSLLDAHAAGLDAFITGEASEQTWHEAAESGCHCYACGHYATERHAIHALVAHVAERFSLEHTRIDQPKTI